MKLDHTIILNCKLVPWTDCNNDMLFSQLTALSRTNIHDPQQVDEAIKALEWLELKLSVWMIEHEAFTVGETEQILQIYRKHLTSLKTHEGIHFGIAMGAFRKCLRIIQFIIQMLFDGYGYEAPAAIRDLGKFSR